MDDDIWPEAANDVDTVHEEALAQAIKLPDQPWKDKLLETLDKKNLDDFVREFTVTKQGYQLAKAMMMSDEGTDLEQIGLLGWLMVYKLYANRESTHDEMSAYRFPHGAGTLCQAMAESLEKRVCLGKALSGVENSVVDCTLRFVDGETAVFDKVVLAIPAQAVSSLSWAPELPQQLDNALDYAPRTPTMKIALVFARRFWESSEFGGSLLSNMSIQQVWSGGREDAAVLLCYVNGAQVDELLKMDKRDMQDKILGQIEQAYPGARDSFVSLKAHTYHHNPYLRGGFTYTPPGYGMNAARYLGKPVGNVHFAGEWCSNWLGFIEGALESAERVLAELS